MDTNKKLKFNIHYKLVGNNEKYFIQNKKTKQYFEIDHESYVLINKVDNGFLSKDEYETEKDRVKFFYEKNIILDIDSNPPKIRGGNRFNITKIRLFSFNIDKFLNKYEKITKLLISRKFQKICNTICVLSIFSILITLPFFIINNHFLKQLKLINLSSSQYIIFYLLIFIMTSIHEIGHIIQCKKYCNHVGECGVMLFFLFPVLYTDVTIMRTIEKKEKYKISFAGIFNQIVLGGILGIVVFVEYFLTNKVSSITLFAFFMNILTLIANLNPFFKYDGYWILSIYVGIENLYYNSILHVLNKLKIKKMKYDRKILLYGVFLIGFYFASWIATIFILYSTLINLIGLTFVSIIVGIITLLILFELYSNFKVKNRKQLRV